MGEIYALNADYAEIACANGTSVSSHGLNPKESERIPCNVAGMTKFNSQIPTLPQSL